jgi:hypothetical protein
LVRILASGKGGYVIFLSAAFEVLTAVLLKIQVLWNVMPCNWAYISLYFKGLFFLHLQVKALQEEKFLWTALILQNFMCYNPKDIA